ncbi:MAG: YkvA family protein [bacterium]|nr:YkvA family protein [bacterium]
MVMIKGFNKEINYKKLFRSYEKNIEKEIRVLEKKAGSDFRWKEEIAAIPNLLNLLVSILDSPLTPTVYRVRIITCIAYLIAPVDVIPQEVYGLEGYVDDFSAVVLVLDSIRKNLPQKLILENWKGKFDIIEFLDNSICQTKVLLDKNILREFQRIFDPEGE